MARTAKKKVAVYNEGFLLIDDADSFNFSGSGVSGVVLGRDVTETFLSSGGTTIITTTGTINDSNTVFPYASKPMLININGVFYRENHGWTWNAGTLTATYDNPVGTGGDTFGI